MKKESEVTLLHMCEPGRFEWHSLCLLSSILALCTDDYNLVAYRSQHKIGKLRHETISFHERHGIPLVAINTEGPFLHRYDIGAKIVATNQRRIGKFGVLLDADTMLVSNTSFAAVAWPRSVVAFPSIAQLLPSIEDWARIFGIVGLSVPPLRFTHSRANSYELRIPYFNAGVVIFPEPDAGHDLGASWIEVTRNVWPHIREPAHCPLIDPIALPIAAFSAGLSIQPLDRAYNFPVEQKGKVFNQDVRLIHYPMGINMHRCSVADMLETIVREATDFHTVDASGKVGYEGRR